VCVIACGREKNERETRKDESKSKFTYKKANEGKDDDREEGRKVG
jgi:hypothetical protein